MMFRYRDWAADLKVAFWALLLLCLSVVHCSTAQACNRAGCGLFGRQCRFQQTFHRVHVPHVKAVVAAVPHYQPPSVLIQNSIYPQPLAATGATDYGISLQSYRTNSLLETAANVNSLLRLSQSVVDGGNALALRVTDTVRETSAAALAVEQSSGAQIAEVAKLMQLAEIARATKSDQVLQTIRIEADGRVNVSEGQQGLEAILATTCAKCHSGGSPKGGFAIDVDWTEEKKLKALAAVRAGKMPLVDGNPVPLGDADKWRFFTELFPAE